MPSLTAFHTFQLPAFCSEIIFFASVEELLLSIDVSKPYWVLGEGSNTVFTSDFEGVVLVNQITGIAHRETAGYHVIDVGAGVNWHQFVCHCLEQGWHGLENLALIPGTVGAAPIQNIGAYGVEVAQFIESVTYCDLTNHNIVKLDNESCAFGYRDSVFKQSDMANAVILKVTFKLPKQYQAVNSYTGLDTLQDLTPNAIFDKVVSIRQQKLPDPKTIGNAGSFFKNPIISESHLDLIGQNFENVPSFKLTNGKVKVPAAWLIDQSGFKGKEVNGIRCHPTQPLVLTNTGEATGESLIAMVRNIIDTVKRNFGIELEPEVRLIGKAGLIKI